MNHIKYFLVLFVVCTFSLFSQSLPKKQTICLNMIVKNESAVITRCLASLRPLIDQWVIVDTGSTDGTQKIILDFLKDVPGSLYERPWINFGHNRNEALQLAKNRADYILFIDADEIFVFDNNFKLPLLTHDFYHFVTDFNGNHYCRVQLIKNALDWKWQGVLHEWLHSPQALTSAIIPGITNVVFTDGARSADPLKYLKDAGILEEALKENPNDSRNVFYLAQSYKDAGELTKALPNYERRVQMGGFKEEIFWSLYEIAQIQEKLGMPPETIVGSYLKAYIFRPTRLEPLHKLARYYRFQENYAQAYFFANVAYSNLVKPNDLFLIENYIYEYDILLELSISAYWLKRYGESYKYSLKLLENPNLPPHVRLVVERNLANTEVKFGEAI